MRVFHEGGAASAAFPAARSVLLTSVGTGTFWRTSAPLTNANRGFGRSVMICVRGSMASRASLSAAESVSTPIWYAPEMGLAEGAARDAATPVLAGTQDITITVSVTYLID